MAFISDKTLNPSVPSFIQLLVTSSTQASACKPFGTNSTPIGTVMKTPDTSMPNDIIWQLRYLFTLVITNLNLSLMAIKGLTMEISLEVINCRKLKLTSFSKKKMKSEYATLNGDTIYCRFYMPSLWEHIASEVSVWIMYAPVQERSGEAQQISLMWNSKI